MAEPIVRISHLNSWYGTGKSRKQVLRDVSLTMAPGEVVGVVKALCSRVVVMKQGKIVESGPVDDVFYHPREDYTKLLIASRPARKKLRGGGNGA